MPSDAKLLRDARALVADVKRMGESEDVGIVRQAILDAREDYLAMLESRADTRTVAAHMRAGPSAAEKAAIARSAAAVSAKAPAPARRPSAAGLFNAMLMLEDARAQREACALLAELKSIGVDGDPLASLNAALEEARELDRAQADALPKLKQLYALTGYTAQLAQLAGEYDVDVIDVAPKDEKCQLAFISGIEALRSPALMMPNDERQKEIERRLAKLRQYRLTMPAPLSGKRCWPCLRADVDAERARRQARQARRG